MHGQINHEEAPQIINEDIKACASSLARYKYTSLIWQSCCYFGIKQPAFVTTPPSNCHFLNYIHVPKCASCKSISWSVVPDGSSVGELYVQDN